MQNAKKKRKYNDPLVTPKRIAALYLMALPGLVYMLINNYMPMFGAIMAFKKVDFKVGILRSPWNGIENFRYLFSTPDAGIILRNTIGYNVVWWFIGTALAITLAILINEIENTKVKKAFQSLTLLPYLMGWVVVSYLVNILLSAETGLINNAILKPLGLKTVNWYLKKQYWPFILTFVHIWKGIGYSLIVYLSSIVGLGPDLFEAARIDGATKWQQIRHITLPLIRPTAVILGILAIGSIMYSDFGLFYQVPRNVGILYSVTNTLDVYVFNALMNNHNYALSSAASFFQSIIGFVLIIVTNMIVRKLEPNSALF